MYASPETSTTSGASQPRARISAAVVGRNVEAGGSGVQRMGPLEYSFARVEPEIPPCPHRPPRPGCPRYGQPGIDPPARKQLRELAVLVRA
jgi:hypothetical protein